MSIKIVKGSYSTTLDSASLSGDQTVTLPNASGTLTLSSQLATVATSGAYNDLSGKPTLAKVATSGSYNDLSNKPSIPSTPQGYVTQTWRSGNNWYRVWNDGFIEQGGYITSLPTGNENNGNNYSTVALPITFNNTYYTVSVLPEINGNRVHCDLNVVLWSKSNAQFVTRNYDGGNVGTMKGSWYACGY